MFNILLSTASFHFTPYPTAPTLPIPVSTCYLTLSVEFKTTFHLFPPCRAEQLISMLLINHFLINCSLNHSTQTGDLEELFWLIYNDIKGLLWALPPTLLPALSPTERAGFGLCIHISLPSVSFFFFGGASPRPTDEERTPLVRGGDLGPPRAGAISLGPSVSFSPLHFDDTLLPPWEGKQLGLGLAQADCDYNHEIKRHLLLGRKAMTNLDSVLKSRDIALLTKIHIVKAMLFQ